MNCSMGGDIQTSADLTQNEMSKIKSYVYVREAKSSLTAAKFKEEQEMKKMRFNSSKNKNENFYSGAMDRNKNGFLDWKKLMPKEEVFDALGWEMKGAKAKRKLMINLFKN